jgi:hypothetical protein
VVSAGPVGRLVILLASEPAPLGTVAPFVTSLVEVASPHADRPMLVAAPTQPLFVRHCALLI